MPTLIERPAEIAAAGHPPKTIREFIGRLNTGTEGVSIAHMVAPGGWIEPGQTPEFDEYTIVLRGELRVEHHGGVVEVKTGQAVVAHKGEWVRYSTPNPEGSEYLAICIPAFGLKDAHRDA